MRPGSRALLERVLIRGSPMSRVVPQPDLLSKLGSVVLPEAEGKQVRIGDLWAKHTLIIVHLRHFG